MCLLQTPLLPHRFAPLVLLWQRPVGRVLSKGDGSSSQHIGAVQAGSMDFLASQGFDFNKWVHSGVPFMRLSERDRCLRSRNPGLDTLQC